MTALRMILWYLYEIINFNIELIHLLGEQLMDTNNSGDCIDEKASEWPSMVSMVIACSCLSCRQFPRNTWESIGCALLKCVWSYFLKTVWPDMTEHVYEETCFYLELKSQD